MSLRLLIGLLLVLVTASAVEVVRAKHDHRQQFVALGEAEKVRDALEIEYNQLQLEQATYAESTLVDRIARERLGMVPPQAEDIVVVRP